QERSLAIGTMPIGRFQGETEPLEGAQCVPSGQASYPLQRRGISGYSLRTVDNFARAVAELHVGDGLPFPVKRDGSGNPKALAGRANTNIHLLIDSFIPRVLCRTLKKCATTIR